MDEQWKDIPGYEGIYQVSTLGNVRSLPRTRELTVTRRGEEGIEHWRLKGKMLTPIDTTGRGYVVRLYNPQGIRIACQISHLVLQAFKPSAYKKFMTGDYKVVFKNEDRNDCRLCNLGLIKKRKARK